ncbi:MAG: ABC transporter permease subunit [Myxococcales bacterium]|nr:ABC transporter permease subunit [Myxococcales bacterium]
MSALVRKLAAAAGLLPLLLLLAMLAALLVDGVGALGDALGDLLPALLGSLGLVGLAAALAVPVGVGAAIYLEEYLGGLGGDRHRSKLARIIELNLANLEAVPSLLYGLLALVSFAWIFGGPGLAAGAGALALVILPIVISQARAALRTVPLGLREAALALGATRWRVVRSVVLPEALPGILSGVTRALARAFGEAAPLLVLGGLGIAALPVQIFAWLSEGLSQGMRGDPGQAMTRAAAALLIALLLTSGLELAALLIDRGRARRT